MRDSRVSAGPPVGKKPTTSQSSPLSDLSHPIHDNFPNHFDLGYSSRRADSGGKHSIRTLSFRLTNAIVWHIKDEEFFDF